MIHVKTIGYERNLYLNMIQISIQLRGILKNIKKRQNIYTVQNNSKNEKKKPKGPSCKIPKMPRQPHRQ